MLSKRDKMSFDGTWRMVFHYGALWYVSVFFFFLIFGFLFESATNGSFWEALLWAVFLLMWTVIFFEFSWNFVSCLSAKATNRRSVAIYPTILKFILGERQLGSREIAWLVVLATLVYLVAFLFWLAGDL